MASERDPLIDRLEAPPADGDSIEGERLRWAVRSRLLDETVPETRIDRYVVLERLGVGGMGVVYAARDTQLDRKVAIKLVRHRGRDARDDDQERLVREARALAQLSHPNVVAIYDVGIHRDRVFIAMELVQGTTLGRWVANGTRAWTEIVRCFAQAAEGLAAAHAVGLVHRDFKPDNVLVGDDGRVRVLDFGLARGEGMATISTSAAARLVPSASLTATGKFVGTPAYIAPENYAGAPADARSDQFSFCVAFWEALFGERPFVATSMLQLSTLMAAGKIAKPAHPERAPQWLRDVIVRGLAADPALRWPSMTALLDACTRRPRRRRWLGFGAAIVMATIAAVLGARALLQSQRLAACDSDAEELASVWNAGTALAVHDAFASTGVGHARETATRVDGVLGEYARAWADVHARGCRARSADALDDAAWALRKSCLEDRRDGLVTLIEVLQSADREVVNQAVRVAYNLPRPQGCEEDARLAANAASLSPTADLEAIAELRRRMGRAELLANASGEDPLTLAVATRDDAAALGEPSIEAQAELALAAVQAKLGDYEAAARSYERAYFGAAPIGADEIALVASTRLVDIVGIRLARIEDALAWSRHAEVLVPRSGESRPWRAADLAENVASVLHAKGDYEAARRSYEEAITLRIEYAGPDHPAVGRTWATLGAILAERKAVAQAVPALDEAERILVAAYGPEALVLAVVYTARGHVAEQHGDHEGFAREAQRVLELREALLEPDHPNIAASLSNLATARLLVGDLEDARSLLTRAIEIRRKRLGPRHAALATSLNNLGVVDIHAGQYEAALGHLAEALLIRRSALPPHHPDTASTITNMGDARLDMHDPTRAFTHYDEAVETCVGDSDAIQRERGRALAGRGMANLALGRITPARSDLAAAFATPWWNDESVGRRCELQHAFARTWIATGEPDPRIVEQARTAYGDCVAAGPDGVPFLPDLAAWQSGAMPRTTSN